MRFLWNALVSLLPAFDWREFVQKQGMPTAMLATGFWFIGYEVLIPLRDQLIESARITREANRDLAAAKLEDSVNLGKLTLLFERQQQQPSEVTRTK